MAILPEESRKICGDFRVWVASLMVDHKFLSPALLASKIPAFLQQHLPAWFPADALPREPAIVAEIALRGVAIAYGPKGADPPEEVLADLVPKALFTHPGDQRAIERILVDAVLRPPGPSRDWQHRWLGAWDALFHLIRPHLLAWLDWTADHVLRIKRKEDRQHWVHQEADALAAIIRGALVSGCSCWERWADFHIQKELLAQQHCANRHRLATWQGQEALDDFLIRAAVQTQLPVGGPNDVRRGILVKHVLGKAVRANNNQDIEGLLCAGPVLRCGQPDYFLGERAVQQLRESRVPDQVLTKLPPMLQQTWPAEEPFLTALASCLSAEELAAHKQQLLQRAAHRCPGEIQLNDTCDRCRRMSEVHEPSWWLWVTDERTAWHCRRCRHCDCLYFQAGGDCLHCAANDWSSKATEVWVPARLASLESAEPTATRQTSPSEQVGAEEERQILIAAIEQWPESTAKTVALRHFRDRRTLVDVAEEFGLKLNGREFNKILAAITQQLKDVLRKDESNDWSEGR